MVRPAPQLLGLGVGGADAIIFEQRGHQIAEERVQMARFATQLEAGLAMSHRTDYSPSSVSSLGGVNPSSFIPRERPISANTSLISFRDFRPKFLVFSISASDLLTSCQVLCVSAFFRPLALRTCSSSSSTLRRRFSLYLGLSRESPFCLASGSCPSSKVMNMLTCSLRILAP